ncbi:MOSC domain-containing protein [Parvibaculum sp.]|jgi:MOSC domain-containing protein YiiM|uniref:MOSC domain-containing protein n=1 Tax=Parvibaculum sp. TaxID=2024848 RepID=UPI002FDA2D2B
MTASVQAVARSGTHTFGKTREASIRLIRGLGVEGDAHNGVTVQHLSRVARDPAQPNLRQVHLIHAELHAELKRQGFEVKPGDMGENITTQGIDLLSLPAGTRLAIGNEAVVEVTGLRNPCRQLDEFLPGLMAAVLERDAGGSLIRKAGIMGIVVTGGVVSPGDIVRAVLPAAPHRALAVV